MAYRYDYSVFRNNGRNNNKGNNNGYTNNNSTTNDKNEFKAPRELVSISLRDNRVGAYSESGSFNHSFFYNDVTIGALTELEAVLDKINDNDTLEDTIKIIHIPNVILALITGLGDYIRIGKTTNGTVLSQEKIEAFKRVNAKIQAKSFNINIRSYQMCPVEFGAQAKNWITEENKNANAERDGVERVTQVNVNNTTNEAINKLNEQIVKLTMEGKFSEAQQVANLIATMTGNQNPNTVEIEDEPAKENLLAGLEG